MLASAMVIFRSVVNTCEAVGKSCGRRAISDRDMRSERPGFERCPLPVCHWAGLRCGPDKHSEIEKKCKVEKLPDSVVKSETANAQSVLCLVQLRTVVCFPHCITDCNDLGYGSSEVSLFISASRILSKKTIHRKG